MQVAAAGQGAAQTPARQSANLTVSPMSERLAQAWSDALRLAESHPASFGYPSPDTTRNVLVVTTVDAAADALVAQWRTSGLALSLSKQTTIAAPAALVETRRVQRSFAELERIKDDLTFLAQRGVPHAELIFQVDRDYNANRLTISIDGASALVGRALAGRYAADSYTLREAKRPNSVPTTRSADSSAFYGGAIITAASGCSSGFSWIDTNFRYMLTAGHCSPNGTQWVSTPADSQMGSIQTNARENWNTSVGTVFLPNDGTYRGDIALVQITCCWRDVAALVYSGGANDNITRAVKEMWSRSPALGDQFCTDGSNTFEICGWQVSNIGSNVQYTTPNGPEWVRNITTGYKYSAPCTNRGDSGGPVYTIRGDGGVAAKGIISGKGGSGQIWDPCMVYFTDIWLPYYGFPGWLKL